MSDKDSYYSASASETSYMSCDTSFDDSTPSLKYELENLFARHKHFLNICHINAQSIPSHYSELEDAFDSQYIHAVLISESWLKPHLPSTAYTLHDFVLIRNDRVDKGGGGVAIYLRASIPYKIVLSSPSNYTASPEYLFLDIDVNGTRAILGVVYCPPSVDYFTALEVALDSVGSEYSHYIIMGDFNTNLLNHSIRSHKLRSIVESCNLSILPLVATHHNIDTDDSWIDHIITTSPDHVRTHGQLSASGFSRHDLIYISYKIKSLKCQPAMVYSRNFNRINLSEFKHDAASIDMSLITTTSDLDDKITILNNAVITLYDSHAPLRKIKLKHSPAPWMTNGVRMAMKKRNRAFTKYKKARTADNWQLYKISRNRCNQMVRIAKRRFIQSTIINSSSSVVWKFLNSFGIGKSPTLSFGTSITLDDINQHFSTKSSLDPNIKLNTISSLSNIDFPKVPTFQFSPVNQEDVEKFILAIKSKAMGYDQINRSMIIPILESLLPVITHIINHSLETGHYPSLWKYAFVRPLPKTTNPSLPNHFRPISILPFLSKILESCVNKQFTNFTTQNNLLNNLQSGFRKGHSTTTALIKVTDDIRRNMDNKKITVLVLVDFSNAFNTVDHDILLSILFHLNLSSLALDWFASYLRGRQQSVRLGQLFSDWVELDSGVPQGGILSPLLFSIFINSITSLLNCSYHLYADDLQLYIHTSVEDLDESINLMNRNLETIRIWSCKFGIAVNPAKCQSIIIGSSKMLAKVNLLNLPLIFYNGIDIPLSHCVKNLGLLMDSTLSWRDQVSAVSSKVVATLRLLYRLKHFLSFKMKLMIITTLVLPILDYADVCYPDLTEELLNKLERLLNNCIRFIFGLRKFDHISQYRSQLKWLPIRQRRNSRILLVLYSILNNPDSPAYLKENIQYLCSTHDRCLRSTNNLMLLIPPHVSGYFGNSFSIQAALLWNTLPENVRKAQTKLSFKRKLRALLLGST